MKGKYMRALSLAATILVLVSCASAAEAMTGGGNLSPEESPYAILEPQTLSPAAMAPEATEAPPAAPTHHVAKHRLRLGRRQKAR
jgi:hypothetical protein